MENLVVLSSYIAVLVAIDQHDTLHFADTGHDFASACLKFNAWTCGTVSIDPRLPARIIIGDGLKIHNIRVDNLDIVVKRINSGSSFANLRNGVIPSMFIEYHEINKPPSAVGESDYSVDCSCSENFTRVISLLTHK